jgi:hypothetical protein
MVEERSAPYIRFRLVNLDSYQANYTDLDRDDFLKVPIIRIWGAVDVSGQTVSLYLSLGDAHGFKGVLPYSRGVPLLLHRVYWGSGA